MHYLHKVQIVNVRSRLGSGRKAYEEGALVKPSVLVGGKTCRVTDVNLTLFELVVHVFKFVSYRSGRAPSDRSFSLDFDPFSTSYEAVDG